MSNKRIKGDGNIAYEIRISPSQLIITEFINGTHPTDYVFPISVAEEIVQAVASK